MEIKLNTSNPESITYQTEEIRYTILGGVRLEGLDRLRVTIKIEVVNRKRRLPAASRTSLSAHRFMRRGSRQARWSN